MSSQLRSQRLAILKSEDQLQQQWGIYSLQQTILPSADGLFLGSDAANQRGRGDRQASPRTKSASLNLGSHRFDLILADEDAKVNLNAAFQVLGETAARQAAVKLSPPGSQRLLQPSPPQAGSSLRRGANAKQAARSLSEGLQYHYQSWGQLFDLSRIANDMGDDRYLANLTGPVTIFGNGRLNVLRASDQAIETVCSWVVTDGLAKRVSEKIRSSTLNEIPLMLEQTVANLDDRLALQQLLSVNSTTYSLWIESTGRHTRGQRLSVRLIGNDGPQQIEFSSE
jgi:hypothetical protein